MKTFIKEFKEFISRGNVIDMAVGVIIGGAHNKGMSILQNGDFYRGSEMSSLHIRLRRGGQINPKKDNNLRHPAILPDVFSTRRLSACENDFPQEGMA